MILTWGLILSAMSWLYNNILLSQNYNLIDIVTNKWKWTIFIKKTYCVKKIQICKYFLHISNMKDKLIITYQGGVRVRETCSVFLMHCGYFHNPRLTSAASAPFLSETCKWSLFTLKILIMVLKCHLPYLLHERNLVDLLPGIPKM